MKSIAYTLFVASLILFSGHQLFADVITFDFGSGLSPNNTQGTEVAGQWPGNWNPFTGDDTDALSTVMMTVGGLQMTMTGNPGTAGTGNWGINTQGVGIRTTGEAGATGFRRRIDGSISESVTFSFDQDVSLGSIRLGSFAGNNTDVETATVTVSGGPTITINSDVSSATVPLTNWNLADTFVAANTDITLTTSATATIGSGVLFNEITVDAPPVPEPGSLLFIGGTMFALALRRRRSR